MTKNDDLWAAVDGGGEKKPAGLPIPGQTPRRPAGEHKKRMIIAGGAVVGCLALAVGIFAMVPGGDDEVDALPKAEPIAENSYTPPENEEWYFDEKASAPTPLAGWQTAPAAEIDKENISKEQITYSEKVLEETPLLGTVKTGLPTSEGGTWSSDIDDMYTKDGLPNPFWTLTTDEDFTVESTLIVEMFLNPIYGDWGEYQFPSGNAAKNATIKNMDEIFSPAYLKKHKNSKDRSYLPIFADWKGNNYGIKDLIPEGSSARWYGTVKSATLKLGKDEKLHTNIYNVEYKVEFTSLKADKSKVKKQGVLKVSFIGNQKRANGNATSYTIQVNDASLEVK